MIKENGIAFKDNVAIVKEVHSFFKYLDDNKQVLLIRQEIALLSSIKVCQVLRDLPEKEDKYIFLQLKSLPKDSINPTKAFETGGIDCLILECDQKLEQETKKILRDVYEVVKNPTKKIILIMSTSLIDLFIKEFSISEEMYKIIEDKDNHFTDLTQESQTSISERERIIFQGNEVLLKTLIEADLYHIIDEEILRKILGGEGIQIGEALPGLGDLEFYYINRTLNRKVKIKVEYFKKRAVSDLFALSNITKTEFCELVSKGTQVCNFEENNPSSNFIIIGNENPKDNFEILCRDYCNRNIHWLKREAGQFIWQKSHGVLSTLRQFIHTNEQNSIRQEPKDLTEKVVIVAAEPGMGKSAMLTHLAMSMKEESDRIQSTLWIIRINLFDHSSVWQEWKKKHMNINTLAAVKFLCGLMNFRLFNGIGKEKRDEMIEHITEFDDDKLILKSNTEKMKGLALMEIELFIYLYNHGKIVLLFDGFDEISPLYKEKIIELLRAFKSTKVQKLWITTRPYNIQTELEDNLSTLCYTLEPFDCEDQKLFLKKFWHVTDVDIRSQTFINMLLEGFSKSTNDPKREFISNPLQTRMVAEVFHDSFKEFNSSGNSKFSDKQKLEAKLKLNSLYKDFVEMKFDNSWEKQVPNKDIRYSSNMQDLIEEKRAIFMNNHEILALHALFENNELRRLLLGQEITDIEPLIESVKSGREKSGIIDKIVDARPIFVHRTFAEYFAASYIWKTFKSIEYDKFTKEDFIQNIIIDILIEMNRIQICAFLQSAAQNDLLENKDIFIARQDKIKSLLIKLCIWINLGPNTNEQGSKLLLGIIEFYVMKENKHDIENVLELKTLPLLTICAEMGYMNLINTLTTGTLPAQLGKESLKCELRISNWEYTPLWLAAKGAHHNIMQFLNGRFYDTNWEGEQGETLLQRILHLSDLDVLRSCVTNNVVDLNASFYRDSSLELPLLFCINHTSPPDIIEFLIRNTDFRYINQSVIENKPATYCVIKYLLEAGLHLMSVLVDRGIDLNAGYASRNLPINIIAECLRKNMFGDYKQQIRYFNLILCLLENGSVYNLGNDRGHTALQYAKQIRYTLQLFKIIFDKGTEVNNLLYQALDKVLQLMLERYNHMDHVDFEGYRIIKKNGSLRFSPSYRRTSRIPVHDQLLLAKDIIFTPRPFHNLLFQVYEMGSIGIVHEALNELSCYQNKFRACHREGYEALKKHLEKDCNGVISNMLVSRILRLVTEEHYELSTAFDRVRAEVLKFIDKMQNFVEKLPEIKDLERIWKTQEVLNMLGLEDYRVQEAEIEALIMKINKCGGLDVLHERLIILNSIGQNSRTKIAYHQAKYFEQSPKIYELFKTVDDLFNAIKCNDQHIFTKVQEAQRSGFLKAAINARDTQGKTLLYHAEENGRLELMEYLQNNGADPEKKIIELPIILEDD